MRTVMQTTDIPVTKGSKLNWREMWEIDVVSRMTEDFMQVEMKLYGQYPILVGDNASLFVSATLGELNSPGCPGRQYHTGILQIVTNVNDAVTKLHNVNLNTTLPEEVHASLKAYLSDATNSSRHDKVTQPLLYPPFNMIVPGMGVEQYGSQ